jgi:predicted permease
MRALDEIVGGVRAIPSVRAVGVTDWLPLSDDRNNSTTEVEDQPLPPNTVPPVHDIASVTGDYFAAMGIPLATGRTFGALDAANPPLEAIVTQAYARRYWRSASPLGKRLRPDIQGPWFTIVGVVANSHLESLDTPPEEAVYLPLVQSEHDSAYMSSEIALVVRTRAADPTSVASGVRRVVHDVDAALPIYEEQPLAAMVASAFARTRFIMLLLALASGIALVLGAVGIYGVMAYGVSLRRREIGVRLALGARPSHVSWMVSRQGLALGGIGVVAGLVAAVGVTRVLRGLLYDVSPADPVTLTAAAAALLVVSLAASWVPARRAATVDPAESLRSE